MMEAERIGGTRGKHFDPAQKSAHGGLRLHRKIFVAQRQPASRILLLDRPDDRGPVTLRVVIHRQERERTRWIEDLIGNMIVRLLVTQYRNDRLVIVLPSG